MKILDVTRGRGSFTVELSHSILYECALGIAAATYPQIQHTLEQTAAFRQQQIDRLSVEARREIQYCQQNNTWKALLQLLHQQSFADLESFLTYIEKRDSVELRYESLPFLGFSMQETRRKAAEGDKTAMELLIQKCQEHIFFPSYIRHICQVEIGQLRAHLISLMNGWYQANLAADEEQIAAMLKRDYEAKSLMQDKLPPESLIESATGGIDYRPEPEVTRVLLVPHYIYRPWNIQAEAEHTKIFYYPLADESINAESDPYLPPHNLVQRYKALGDEHRLRIVKLLFESDHTLQELSEKLDLAKSTIHHHLSMLRAARLVETKGQRYCLKQSVLPTLPLELKHFLEQGGPSIEKFS